MNFHAAACRNLFSVFGWLLIATTHVPEATKSSLFSFESTSSPDPWGRLLIDNDRILFGSTERGGLHDAGTVFKFDTTTNMHEQLVSFTQTNGSYPVGSLIKDAAGNLYGTTMFGGGSSEFPLQRVGTAFRLDASNDYNIATLVDFESSGIIHPYGGLIADSDGNLYGTATGDIPLEGTVFKLDASRNYESSILTKFSFDAPGPGLHSDSAGNLYGTTNGGDKKHPFGSVFKLDKSDNFSLRTLATFAGDDGEFPNGNLIADSAGNLFGTTARGGSSDAGTIFRLDASNNYALTTIVNFNGDNGAEPTGGLLADAAGNLYGVTYGGGSGHGTVFKLDDSNNFQLTTIANFHGDNGSGPIAGLAVDAFGNLFGTTFRGGDHNRGTVFKLEGAGFVVPEPSRSILICILTCFVAFRARKQKHSHSL